jgi:hypothetical protein
VSKGSVIPGPLGWKARDEGIHLGAYFYTEPPLQFFPQRVAISFISSSDTNDAPVL